MEEKKDNGLYKVRKIRLVMFNIFACFVGVTAITGIKSYDRYVPPFLIAILAITGSIMLILSIIILIMKNK
ncbi:hypothetical protein [Tepidibacter hydrothermalis]|uniref:Group-specific protein n=1 Tax=Tepidibacter hydrothermalis TaxID=3036126 RepID=A0ABY8EAK5_9FIRM|nr:hypothetical protein [Tepidibacter hydrothermalis]WFD08834.1 hypothetical protein P4S50_10550 [Tepidibacter hydrothermalis]